MSERPRLLLFEELLPQQRQGDIEPCQAVLETTGHRGGSSLEVILMDRNVALQALTQGGWAREQLDNALALRPTETGLAQGPEFAALALVLGDLPRLTERDRVVIEDYGDLTAALLSNGLRLSSRASPWCIRPGIADPTCLDGRALRDVLSRHAALGKGLDPPRALALELVGMSWLDDTSRRDAIQRAVLDRGFRVGGILIDDSPVASTVSALRWLVKLTLLGNAPAPRLAVDPSAPFNLCDALAARDTLTLDTLEHLDRELRTRGAPEALLRHTDDGARRCCFAAITDSRARHDPAAEACAVGATTKLFGPPAKWIRSYRQSCQGDSRRIVLIPTWQCELRCKYCRIPKQDGREMSPETIDRSLDLLFSADGADLDLHFFGGEPLAAWDAITHTLTRGHARANAEGRTLRFLFTTNGWALTRERFDWLARFPVWFQLSLDGDSATQNAIRPPLRVIADSYQESPATKASWFLEAGIAHDVVQVVHPSNVERMADNFRHILDLGYRRIQLNYALGTIWERAAIEEFGRQLARVDAELAACWQREHRAELVNLEETLLPVRGNLEVTVDSDGTIFGSSAFLVNTKHREAFRLGHLNDARGFERYQCDGLQMDDLLANWFSAEMAQNNRQVGAVLMSFVRHMRQKHPSLELRGSERARIVQAQRGELR